MNTLEIRHCPALARTQLTLTGVVDAATIKAVRAAVVQALGAGRAPVLCTEHVCGVERSEVETLIGFVELYGVTNGPLLALSGYDSDGRREERARDVCPQHAARRA